MEIILQNLDLFIFLALMVLSTTMAAVGLMQNSAAVVIGAMVIAHHERYERGDYTL